MQDRWIGKNVDLNMLGRTLEEFFVERQFESKLEKTQNGYRIDAVTQKILSVELKILVEISGQPGDFTVEFTAGKKRKGFFSPSMVIGYLTSFLGGGTLLLKEAKLREALDRLEKLFWSYADKQIAQLANSASR